MKYLLYLLIVASLSADVLSDSVARYISHIKVIDDCTYMVEPLKIDALGIKGGEFEPQKAIRACKKSLRKYPSDPHVQFLLARSYSKGAVDVSDMDLPKSVLLEIPEFNGIKPKYDLGYELARISCLGGDPGGCGLLGYYYYHGLHKAKYSTKKTYLLWQWACSEGNMLSCYNLSILVDNGNRYITKDSRNSISYSLQACMSGLYPHACETLSDQMYLRKNILKKNIEDKELLTYVNYKACESGFNNACYFLKKQLKEQNSTEFQEAVLKITEASCNNGNTKACETLGDEYANKPRNKVNNLMASTFYESACNNGAERFACWYAGMYKLSQMDGIVQDIDLGLKYLNKSCYIGQNSFSCYDLANFYFYTKDEKYKNRDEGLKVMELSCKVGNVRAAYRGCDEGIKTCCDMKEKIQKDK